MFQAHTDGQLAWVECQLTEHLLVQRRRNDCSSQGLLASQRREDMLPWTSAIFTLVFLPISWSCRRTSCPCWCWWVLRPHELFVHLYFSSERAQQVLPSQGRSTAEAFAESVAVLPLHFLASCPQSPFSLLQMKFRGRGACSYHTQTAFVKSQNSKKFGHWYN